MNKETETEREETKETKEVDIKARVQEILLSDNPELETIVEYSNTYHIGYNDPYSKFSKDEMVPTGTEKIYMTLREKKIRELLDIPVMAISACEKTYYIAAYTQSEDKIAVNIERNHKVNAHDFKPSYHCWDYEDRMSIINSATDANEMGRIYIDGNEYITTNRIGRILSLSEKAYEYESDKKITFKSSSEIEQEERQKRQEEAHQKEEENRQEEKRYQEDSEHQEEKRYQEDSEHQGKVFRQEHPVKFTLVQIKNALSRLLERGE